MKYVVAKAIVSGSIVAVAFFCCAAPALAQTAAQNQLRATIKSEILSDPRSQNLTQAQMYSLVNALTSQAQEQGLTTAQITYRPQTSYQGGSTITGCSDISCSLSQAFGLDGSIPFMPIALLVLAILFIFIYAIMREVGHPHVKP